MEIIAGVILGLMTLGAVSILIVWIVRQVITSLRSIFGKTRDTCSIPGAKMGLLKMTFASWDHHAVRELEATCRKLPVLPLERVKDFFKQASVATQKDASVVERQSGKLFEGMTGFVAASDRKHFSATCDNGNPVNAGHGVMVVETYDKTIPITYCLSRFSDVLFLTCAWVGEESRQAVKGILSKPYGSSRQPEPSSAGTTHTGSAPEQANNKCGDCRFLTIVGYSGVCQFIAGRHELGDRACARYRGYGVND